MKNKLFKLTYKKCSKRTIDDDFYYYKNLDFINHWNPYNNFPIYKNREINYKIFGIELYINIL